MFKYTRILKLNLTTTAIIKLENIAKEENEVYTDLLNFLLVLNTKKQAVIKHLTINLSEETFNKYIYILNKIGVLTKEDQLLIKKLSLKSNSKKVEISKNMIPEEIINNLNNLTNSRRKLTKVREGLILKWLRLNYSLEDFKLVNYYFYNLWVNDSTMSQYIKPETLYNGKFEARLEEASLFKTDFDKFEKEISLVYEAYMFSYNKYINNNNFNFTNDLIKSKLIIFWLNRFTIEDMLLTIDKTIEQWSKNPSLISKITLNKILDNKFHERELVAKGNLLQSKPQDLKTLNDWVFD